MGGGDLNLKKSWHPLTMKNQERVWKEERKAMDEQKKLDQLRKEISEERAKQELLELQEQAGLIKRSDRIDWMYSGPGGANSLVTSEREDFLLGKKRVDVVLSSATSTIAPTITTVTSNRAVPGNSTSLANPNANTGRDLMNKVREDPLFMIKKREQDTIKMIMNNPLKVKAIKEAFTQKKDKKKDKKRERKDRSEVDTNSRHYERSSSDRQDYPRLRSPPSRQNHGRYRSPSLDRRKNTRYSSGTLRQRSISPPTHRIHRYRSRSRSPDRLRRRHDSPSPPRSPKRFSTQSSRPTGRNTSTTYNHVSNTVDAEKKRQEQQARLQAMQADAVHLHTDRLERLAQLDAIDKLETERESNKLNQRSVNGDAQSRFYKEAYGLNGNKGVKSLSEALERNKFYLERTKDELDS